MTDPQQPDRDPIRAAPEVVPSEAQAPAEARLPERAVAGRPLWTYFLAPAAILIGSVLISATMWYVDDASPAVVAPDGTPSGDGVSAVPSTGPTEAAESKAPPSNETLRSLVSGYEKQIGIDDGKFNTCLGDNQTVKAINAQLQEGVALGVTGTPTFFVNNKMIVGAQPTKVFQEVIQAELDGSPTTLDGYSATVKQLAASGRFSIADAKPDVSTAQIQGAADAKVVIAEFSDFQCPFCKRWVDDTLKALKANLGADVSLAFVNFPIVQIHPNAANAAAIAYCAGQQGKFWQMHDLLFKNQADWAGLKAQ